MGTAEASQAHLGKKELTTLHAIGQALALGQIFSAALFLGFMSLFAGFSSPVSILLGGVLKPDRVRL
jgi:hypothetical protein